ncbi:hypothetical protein Tco_0916941 [Tanacetum coccineum]
MSQDQSIPRRNKVDWHMANDDPILTTMRFIPQHEVVQQYGAILPENLTTQAMKESKAYKSYYAFATGKAIPKPKYVRRSTKEKPKQAPEATSGKRLKAIAKMKLAIERSKTQLHSSQPSGSSAHEGTGVTPGVPDVPKYGTNDEQLSWKYSNEEDDDDEANIGKDEDDDYHDDDDDERTESDNDGEDFVHPKFSTHDDEARQEEVNKEDSFDPRVQTPSHVESTDDDNNDDGIQSVNVAGEEMDEEAINAEGEEKELFRDVNVNLERRDVEMIDAQQTNVQTTQVLEDTHVIITPVNAEDVLVTTIAEPPLVSATTLPPPPTPLITHMQQTPVPTPTTVPRTSLQDLPNLGSLFGFGHKLKTLETDFSEFKQTNQFAEAVASIPSIVDAYLANKMNEVIKTAV